MDWFSRVTVPGAVLHGLLRRSFQINISVFSNGGNLAKFEFKVLYAEGCMAQDEGRQKKRGEQGEPRTFCQSTCALLRIMVTME